MGFSATISFQKLHRKLEGLAYIHREGLQAAGEALVRVMQAEYLSGGTTSTRLAVRSGQLYSTTYYSGTLRATGNYFYAEVRFPARNRKTGFPYPRAHIASGRDLGNTHLPYNARINTREVIKQHFPVMQRAFNRATR